MALNLSNCERIMSVDQILSVLEAKVRLTFLFIRLNKFCYGKVYGMKLLWKQSFILMTHSKIKSLVLSEGFGD